MREENIWKRGIYIARMIKLNAEGLCRILYMDESYIHKNYYRHEDSLYDINDEQDQQV